MRLYFLGPRSLAVSSVCVLNILNLLFPFHSFFVFFSVNVFLALSFILLHPLSSFLFTFPYSSSSYLSFFLSFSVFSSSFFLSYFVFTTALFFSYVITPFRCLSLLLLTHRGTLNL